MSKSYSFLNAQPPEFFKDPENLRTDWPIDSDPANMEENYQRGLSISKKWRYVNVRSGGTWGASSQSGDSNLSSYEGLGYHAGTADFGRGVLDGPAEVVVYRWKAGYPHPKTIIKKYGEKVA